MSHEMFRLATATPRQLDVLMAGVVLLMAIGLALLIWLRRMDKKKPPGAPKSSRGARMRKRKRRTE